MLAVRAGLYLQEVRCWSNGAWTARVSAQQWLPLVDEPKVKALAGALSDSVEFGAAVIIEADGAIYVEDGHFNELCGRLYDGLSPVS
jgi:hypothetical protein